MAIAKFRGGGQNPKTPKPIEKKFGVGDYVGDDSLHAKIQNDRPIGGVAAYAWNITLAWFSFPILSYLWPQILFASRDIESIFTWFASYDVNPGLLDSWKG